MKTSDSIVATSEGDGSQAFSQHAKFGDWLCGACQNHNFAFREVCKRCGAPKADGVVQERVGDWSCHECHHYNFGVRSTCRRCGAARLEPDAGATPSWSSSGGTE